MLFSDDAGGFFKADAAFLERYASDTLSDRDLAFLSRGGHAYRTEGDLAHTGFAYRWSQRQAVRRELGYVILVPTLRCNLSCGYCQVSRASESAQGYDWSPDVFAETLSFLDGLAATEIKIEFQGGEPLLRVDLLEQVRAFCRDRFSTSTFVVCTNLQRLGEREWAFLSAPDTFVSTSLDGDPATHQRQRTASPEATESFFANLDHAIATLGPGKVSALPTIDPLSPPGFDELVSAFVDRGLKSIYLRPINHQGFARRGRAADDGLDRWNAYHGDFIERLIERNHRTGVVLEEYYFSQCLKRALRAGADEHVDLRNPNFFADDYIVIDHDGTLYPTDEARMQSRIGRVDLSIGHVRSGVARDVVETLNAASLNSFDPDCVHCPYQPFCGSDIIDDISRYGRIDVPKHDTWFCRRHTSLFDKVFELLYRQDEATRLSLAHWSGVAAWRDAIAPVHA
jgi:His-Xaa-Ser system radical SAM maturase HxsB